MEIQKRNRLPTIAVVILNYNGKRWLEKFLPSLAKFSSDNKIYIIDNNSSDSSIELIQSDFPYINLILNDKNYGFASGYNIGLKNINEDIYCILNSDIEVSEGWLEPIINLFFKDKEISVIQPKILNYKNREYFDFAGGAGGFIDNIGYPFCRGRIFDYIEKDNGQYDNNREIFWASGACFFIRRDDFKKLGGFDDIFFAHMEEIDLCWRLKNINKKIYYCSQSKVYHVNGGTLDSSSPFKTFLNFRNNLLMIVKNIPSYKIIPIILIRLILDGIAGLKFLLEGKLRHTCAIIKAHFSFYYHLPKAIKKRQNGIKKYYYTKYIIFQYFIKKIKTFDELK